MELEKRRKGAAKLIRDVETWDNDALLGLRSFQGKDGYVADEKAKLELPEKVPILVVVPASVVDNWDYEFSMWGHFSVALYRDEKHRKEALEAIKYGSAEILLCGHSLFGSSSHIKEFKKITWKLVIVDEFHGKWNSCDLLRSSRKLSDGLIALVIYCESVQGKQLPHRAMVTPTIPFSHTTVDTEREQFKKSPGSEG